MADIIERIRNLWALSKNNNSPEEAALAAARAQELMFKYQIGESDISLSEDDKREDVVDESILVEEVARRCPWKASLGNSLAHAFGCKLYTWKEYVGKTVGVIGGGAVAYRRECQYRVVGLKSAVQTIGYMFSYLAREVDELAERAWTEARKTGYPANQGRTWKNSFRLGAVNTIAQRLKAQRAEQDAQVEAMMTAAKAARQGIKVTALALYKSDRERVREEYKAIEKKRGLRTVYSSARHTVSAYERGQCAGRDVNLSSGKPLAADKQRIRHG